MPIPVITPRRAKPIHARVTSRSRTVRVTATNRVRVTPRPSPYPVQSTATSLPAPRRHKPSSARPYPSDVPRRPPAPATILPMPNHPVTTGFPVTSVPILSQRHANPYHLMSVLARATCHSGPSQFRPSATCQIPTSLSRATGRITPVPYRSDDPSLASDDPSPLRATYHICPSPFVPQRRVASCQSVPSRSDNPVRARCVSQRHAGPSQPIATCQLNTNPSRATPHPVPCHGTATIRARSLRFALHHH